METRKRNLSIFYPHSQTSGPWLSQDLNDYRDLSELLTDHSQLTTTFSDPIQDLKIESSNAGALSNLATQKTAAKGHNVDKPIKTPIPSNAKSKIQTGSDPAKIADFTNANSTGMMDKRRSQNRIAQRSFRQRKYQYTKSLEVRASELESEVKRLQEENQQLSLSSPPSDQSRNSNPGTTTPCILCRHIFQFWSNGMICPDSLSSECPSNI